MYTFSNIHTLYPFRHILEISHQDPPRIPSPKKIQQYTNTPAFRNTHVQKKPVHVYIRSESIKLLGYECIWEKWNVAILHLHSIFLNILRRRFPRMKTYTSPSLFIFRSSFTYTFVSFYIHRKDIQNKIPGSVYQVISKAPCTSTAPHRALRFHVIINNVYIEIFPGRGCRMY